MSLSFPEIVSIVWARRQSQGLLLQAMVDVQRRYNGDYVIPLPNVDDEEALPPLTPALVAEAIDNVAMRAASVKPYIGCPAIDPTKDNGIRSREYANVRRRILAGTYYKSKLPLGMRRAFRHLAGYATCAVMVVPDYELGMPRVVVRDPLTAFPEPKQPEDLSLPRNAAFIYGKSVDWIRANYPSARSENGGPISANPLMGQEIWDCVEWLDEDDIVIGLMGPRYPDTRRVEYPFNGSETMELERHPNRAGIVPCVIPQRVTLDRIASQVANIVGIVDLMGMLLALDIRATQKAIFPDRYIIGRANATPQLVGGQWKDGSTGEVNIVLDADSIGELRGTPDPNNKQTISMLERNARVSTGLVPQFGGETYGAMRTGRAIDALGGFAVDPRVQELQEIMEMALPHVNEAIFAVYEGYWPDKKYSFFSGWAGDVGQVEFTPQVHIETRESVVAYAIPGADVQNTTIQLGQLLSAKGISQHTFRMKHPWIDDPELEEKQILEEDMDEAMRSALLMRASQGGIPPVDMANIKKLIKQGKPIEEAIAEADRLAQERQAAVAPPPGPDQAMPPEAMAGLANPGEGAEQLAPGMEPPAQGLKNFRDVIAAIKVPQIGVSATPPVR